MREAMLVLHELDKQIKVRIRQKCKEEFLASDERSKSLSLSKAETTIIIHFKTSFHPATTSGLPKRLMTAHRFIGLPIQVLNPFFCVDARPYEAVDPHGAA